MNELSASTILKIRASDPSISVDSAIRLLKAAAYLDTTQEIKNIVRPERRTQ